MSGNSRCAIIGIHLPAEMIALARQKVPGARFMVKDVRHWNLLKDRMPGLPLFVSFTCQMKRPPACCRSSPEAYREIDGSATTDVFIFDEKKF